MVVPSGIVLPGDRPLPVREVMSGLFLVEQTHERDLGFFSESPLYANEATSDDTGTGATAKTEALREEPG